MKNNQIRKINKKVLFISLAIIVAVISIFFIKNNYKKYKIGNNESNKSVDKIKQYILNINSYNAEMEVTINSNKNVSKYLMKQEYTANKIEKQTILEPENIKGLEIIYKDGNLEITNSNLNLNKIYSNYPYLSDNVLWLNSFIKCFNENPNNSKIYEQNEFIIMEINNESNKYLSNRKLYINKNTGKPAKLVVQDNNKKDVIYIVYKRIDY